MRPFIAILMLIFLVEYGAEGWWHPCHQRDCTVSQWSTWGLCSHRCGYSGIQSRHRIKTRDESCGGQCHYVFTQSRSCNRNACRNGGTPQESYCSCPSGWTGTCCERASRRKNDGKGKNEKSNHKEPSWHKTLKMVFSCIGVVALCFGITFCFRHFYKQRKSVGKQ